MALSLNISICSIPSAWLISLMRDDVFCNCSSPMVWLITLARKITFCSIPSAWLIALVVNVVGLFGSILWLIAPHGIMFDSVGVRSIPIGNDWHFVRFRPCG